MNDEKKNTARDAAVDGRGGAAAAVEPRVALSVADAPRERNLRPAGRARVHRRLVFGGVDSMLLAALAHGYVPPGAPWTSSTCASTGAIAGPRRRAGRRRRARSALPGARPAAGARRRGRRRGSAGSSRRARLAGLLRPARTVMDRNIGAALWLAARGEGWIDVASAPAANSRPNCSPNSLARRRAAAADGATAPTACDGVRIPYASRARVLLLGQGADEQCAGYSRHRAAFRAGASSGEAIRALAKEDGPAEGLSPARDWEALGDAVRLDATRLWRRNMGRDDRLVSDRGREARFPFLDEGVAARLLATPLCDVADLSGHEGGQAARPRRRAPARHAPRGGARQARHSGRVARLEKFDVGRRAGRGARRRRGRVGFVDRVRRVGA